MEAGDLGEALRTACARKKLTDVLQQKPHLLVTCTNSRPKPTDVRLMS